MDHIAIAFKQRLFLISLELSDVAAVAADAIVPLKVVQLSLLHRSTVA